MPDRTSQRRSTLARVDADATYRAPTALDRLGRYITPQADGCWIWGGGLTEAGYGQFSSPTGTGSSAVHRITYTILVGPIPKGHHLHHECGVRACCNPAHLTPMTPSDHSRHHAEERWAS